MNFTRAGLSFSTQRLDSYLRKASYSYVEKPRRMIAPRINRKKYLTELTHNFPHILSEICFYDNSFGSVVVDLNVFLQASPLNLEYFF